VLFVPASIYFPLNYRLFWAAKGFIDEPAEKAVPRLAVTYGVLRRLGFAEDKVEQCLRAIPSIGLEEAYEWVSLINCSIIFLYPRFW